MTIEQKYIEHLEKCFENAENKSSKINQEIINMDGMSGLKTRRFYNNLLSINDARWLEIGVWKGTSSCAAMYENKAIVCLIENFAGFGGPKQECMENIEMYKGENDVTFYEEDCFKIDITKFKNKFNIYCYDADHSEYSTKMAVGYFLPVLDEVFVLVMDDWNFIEVRNGTYKGISLNGLEVVWSKEIRLTNDDSHTPHDEAKKSYHNGIAVFVLKKSN